ncbi:MAG: hypothetical protein ACRDTV_05560 [Mycobacterium sp.]
MPDMPARWRDRYGSHPVHLVTMAAGFALLGYLVATVKPMAWWNPHSWWQSIAVWFAGAVVVHDLVLFPIYALADRMLGSLPARRRGISARNHVRIPALGSGLTLLVFLPGVIQQGAPTYLAATGQTQQPFVGRWLLLTAVMFTGSAFVYLIRLAAARRPDERDT